MDTTGKRGKRMGIGEKALEYMHEHVSAVLNIHRILDGVEWDAGTIEEVARVIEPLYPIREPNEIPETWKLLANIGIEFDGDEVVEVTVMPLASDAGFFGDGDFKRVEGTTYRTSDEVNEALGKYLSSIATGTSETDLTYPLRWDG